MLNLSNLTSNLLNSKIDPAIMALAMKHLKQEPIDLPDLRNIVPHEKVQVEVEKSIGKLYTLLHEWQEKRREETNIPSLRVIPQIIISEKGFIQLELLELADGRKTPYARIPLNELFIRILVFIYRSSHSFEHAKRQAVTLLQQKYVLDNQKVLASKHGAHGKHGVHGAKEVQTFA